MGQDVIAIAADHAGFELKKELRGVLEAEGRRVLDLGVDSAEPADYPDVARRLAQAIKDGRAARGVLICGTGIGIGMAANRHPWIRAAPCTGVTSARLAREHNDANVLALGARLTGIAVATDCLRTFLETPFQGGRHARRVEKLGQLDQPSKQA
jgi:ribose 5-phosphate isomerase B